MLRECREHFPRHWFQRKPIVNDPGLHHGTCVTHMPWCMSRSLTRGGGENVPGIPGACATRKFTYLVRGPLWRPLETRIYVWWMSRRHSSDMAINLFKKQDDSFYRSGFCCPIKSVPVRFGDDLMTLLHFLNHLTFEAGNLLVSSGFKAQVVSDAQLWPTVAWPVTWEALTVMGPQTANFMGPTWGHLGPVGPRWAPCWPHEPCYQGHHLGMLL